MSDEEKKEYEKLKRLLYTGTISQYGKRKLIDMFEKQQKEIEELKAKNKNWKDKINKLKEEVETELISNPYDFSYLLNEILEEEDESKS